MTTIEIKGAGGTIKYPTEVIIKALKEAGLQVEVHDEHPAENPEEHIKMTKEKIDSGYIKEWKVVVKATHYPWGG
jgi:UDP-N-acetyl-D-mannosaminuronate dehydrogenase